MATEGVTPTFIVVSVEPVFLDHVLFFIGVLIGDPVVFFGLGSVLVVAVVVDFEVFELALSFPDDGSELVLSQLNLSTSFLNLKQQFKALKKHLTQALTTW